MFGAAKRDKPFKDYCLTLQVHPEADAAMVDAAYWHLAKRYNEAAPYDPKARAKLEELNEAYSVLGSAERREEYMKLRVEALGEDALPQAPRPERTLAPLAVMNRQRPHEREAAEMESMPRHSFTTRKAIGMFVILRLAGVTLAAETSLLIATTAEGAAGIVILAVVAIVASLQRLRVARSESMPRPKSASLPKVRAPGNDRRADGDPLDKTRVQSAQLHRLAAEPLGAPVEIELVTREEAAQMPELEPPGSTGSGEPPAPSDIAAATSEDAVQEPQPSHNEPPEGEPFKHPGHDQFAEIKRQAAQFRRIAESQNEGRPVVAHGDAAPNDSDELAKIERQTERLKSIAAKFNAAKAQSSSEPAQGED